MRPPRRLRIIPDAIRLYLLLDGHAARIRHVRPRISDQLFRAALSVPLNIEEGSYELAVAEKSRFYRIAYRSLAECRVILDILEELGLVPLSEIHEARRHLERLSPQLFNLIKRRRTKSAAN